MKSIADILSKFNPKEDKYVSREFQTFGIHLAEKLGDPRKKALYIKYAKHIPRSILEEALRFVVDANARNKGALFMWKLKELQAFTKYPIPKREKKKSEKERLAEIDVAEAEDAKPKKKPRKKRALPLEDELFQNTF